MKIHDCKKTFSSFGESIGTENEKISDYENMIDILKQEIL